MKINSTPIAVIAIFLFTGLVFFYGCKKEDPLKPNPDMELYQTEHYAGGDGIGGVDTTGTGGGGGGTDTTGGGGTSPNSYFRFDVNGVTENYPVRTYSENSMGVTINAQQGGSSLKQLVINTFGQPVQGDTIDFSSQIPLGSITYNKSIGEVFTPTSGYLIFDKIESGYVQGTFEFIGEQVNNTTVTINVTNGEFSVNK